jgi:Hsp70 protein
MHELLNTDTTCLCFVLHNTGVERAKKGEPKVEVTFTLDANGILNVTACDKVIANNTTTFIFTYLKYVCTYAHWQCIAVWHANTLCIHKCEAIMHLLA